MFSIEIKKLSINRSSINILVCCIVYLSLKKLKQPDETNTKSIHITEHVPCRQILYTSTYKLQTRPFILI